MPFKDPMKRREYQREYNKRRGSGLSKKLAPRELRIDTAFDLKSLLETIIEEVQTSDLDTEPKARVLLRAVEVGLKIVGVTDLEKRLTALENSTNGSGNNDSSELGTQRGVTA